MTRGLQFSLILHSVLLLFVTVSLPFFPRDVVTDYAIVADIVTVSELTNVKIKQTDQKDKTETKIDQTPAPAAPPAAPAPEKPKEPEKQPEAKPLPKNEEKVAETAENIPDKTKKEPKKEPQKEEPKKETKKPAPKQEPPKKDTPAKKDDSFEKAILKSLEGEKKQKPDNSLDKKFQELEDAVKGDTNKDFNPNLAMSISEIDAIKSQITSKWNTSAFSGADSKGMRVTILITLDPTATVISVTPKLEDNTSPYYQAFVASCVRAIKSASPLQHLSKEKYTSWQEIEFTFDSSGMIY